MKYLVCPVCCSDDINEEGINNPISTESLIECNCCGKTVVNFMDLEEVRDFIASDNKLSRIFDNNYKLREEYKEDGDGNGGERFLIDVCKATPFELYVHAASVQAPIYNQALMQDTIVTDYSVGYRRDILERGTIVIEIKLMLSIIVANGGMFSSFITNWRTE